MAAGSTQRLKEMSTLSIS